MAWYSDEVDIFVCHHCEEEIGEAEINEMLIEEID